MLMLEGPANTLNYMVLGFAVILGFMALFIASLVLRFRNLSRDRSVLEDVQTGATR